MAIILFCGSVVADESVLKNQKRYRYYRTRDLYSSNPKLSSKPLPQPQAKTNPNHAPSQLPETNQDRLALMQDRSDLFDRGSDVDILTRIKEEPDAQSKLLPDITPPAIQKDDSIPASQILDDYEFPEFEESPSVINSVNLVGAQRSELLDEIDSHDPSYTLTEANIPLKQPILLAQVDRDDSQYYSKQHNQDANISLDNIGYVIEKSIQYKSEYKADFDFNILDYPKIVSAYIQAPSIAYISDKRNVLVLLPLSQQEYRAPINQVINSLVLYLKDKGVKDINLIPFDTNQLNKQLLVENIKNNNVSLIFGPLFLEETRQVAKILKDSGLANIPVFSYANDPSVSAGFANVLFFGYKVSNQVNSFLQYVAHKKYHNIAIFLPNNSLGVAFYNEFKRLIPDHKKHKLFLLKSELYDTTDVEKYLSRFTSDLTRKMFINSKGVLMPITFHPKQSEINNYKTITKTADVVFALMNKDNLVKITDEMHKNSIPLVLESTFENYIAEDIPSDVYFLSAAYNEYEVFKRHYSDIFPTPEKKISRLAVVSYDMMKLATEKFLTQKNYFESSNLSDIQGFKGAGGQFLLTKGNIINRPYDVYYLNDNNKVELVQTSDPRAVSSDYTIIEDRADDDSFQD